MRCMSLYIILSYRHMLLLALKAVDRKIITRNDSREINQHDFQISFSFNTATVVKCTYINTNSNIFFAARYSQRSSRDSPIIFISPNSHRHIRSVCSWWQRCQVRYDHIHETLPHIRNTTQIAKFMGPAWGPPGSCRPQMSPILAP